MNPPGGLDEWVMEQLGDSQRRDPPSCSPHPYFAGPLWLSATLDPLADTRM